jgi:ElaB/YqjD/DUF883 family membrane-anchored ribosome-binding protein
MSAALRQLRHRAEQYADAAQDTGRHAVSRAEGYADQASGRLGELWSEIEALVGHRGPSVAQRARHYAHDAGEAASDLSDQLVSLTRHRPLVVIGVAVAATWLVSSLLQSPRRAR